MNGMNRTTLHTISGCFLALVLGAGAASVRGFFQTNARSAAPRPIPVESIPTRTIDEQLAETVRTGTGAQRWLLLSSAAENATAADMPGLIRLVRGDSAAIRMLAARWAEIDPRHMLNVLYADYVQPEDAPGTLPNRWELGSVLFEQWTKSDLAGAISALNDVPNFSGRESLRMTVANNAMKADVEQGLRVMKDWNIRNYIPDMKSVADWAARDPRHATETVLKLGSDYVAQEALKQAGKAWARSDPQGALQFAATLDPSARANFSTEVIRSWAERDLAAAAAFAAEQPDVSFRSALAQGLVGTWAKSDPAAALAWSEQNLHGAARADAIAGLIKVTAEKSLTTASELVADMEPGAAQNRACASIFETWFNKGKGEREAAFDWLASLPDAEARRSALERVQWNWMWNDPTAVRDFITGPHGDLASESLVQQVARNQTAKNPEAAMNWANTLPAERAAAARAAVFQNWLMIRPEGAADFARKMPAGPERVQAIRTVSQTLGYQAPAQAAEWYRSLSGDEQKTAREAFGQIGLDGDKRQQLEQALK
jgi:hypothetical protein